MASTYSYNKTEKLKSRKLLDQLFKEGRSVSAFPIKVFYLNRTGEKDEPLQAGVGVSAKNFPKAVHRNRIKRLLREAYRLNKQELQSVLHNENKKLALFILFVGKELPDFELTNQSIQSVLPKLISAIGKS
jgi:ribonuclease P protein component